MKLTMKGEYATRAVLHLARHYPGDVVHIHQIASDEHIPIKYLEQILVHLKNAGIIASRRGVNGGYYLSKPPETITFGEVVRLIEGPLAPIGCVSRSAYESCPNESACGTRGVWLDVRNAVSEILDNTTFAGVDAKGGPSGRAKR